MRHLMTIWGGKITVLLMSRYPSVYEGPGFYLKFTVHTYSNQILIPLSVTM